MIAFGLERRREILGALLLAATLFLFLALATDGYQGENRRSLSNLAEAPNLVGVTGAVVSGILYILMGQASHVVYFITCVWGLMLFCHRPLDRLPSRLAGVVLLTASVSGLLHADFASEMGSAYPGGAMGAFVAHLTVPAFGTIGANVITVTFAFIGILLATEFLFVRMVYGGLNGLGLTIHTLGETRYQFLTRFQKHKVHRAERKVLKQEHLEELSTEREKLTALLKSLDELDELDAPSGVEASAPLRENASAPLREETKDRGLSRMRVRPALTKTQAVDTPFDPITEADREALGGEEFSADMPELEGASQIQIQWVDGEELVDDSDPEEPAGLDLEPVLPTSPPTSTRTFSLRRRFDEDVLPPDYQYPKRYTKPPIDMLEVPREVRHGDLTDSLQRTGLLLEKTLETFGIEARVTDITRGPTITRFELEPSPGVKVSKFMSLSDDLALALKAHRIRVEAPIPGKGRVGIEVPNEIREDVVIRDLLESENFRSHTGALPLAMGKDIEGHSLTADLATMPHLLVAGATGAGKTVCVKTVLASLLFTKTPDELQLMLIDPKMVELSIFNEIPHLITPVVIDPKKAALSLNWLINEMEERYRLFAELRVRNIEVYNQSVENGEIEVEADEDTAAETVSIIRKLPYIVCIIDELADLMMLARAEVEDAIARLAQLARAVGIHLIIATQRPSVDVLTGVIKANFPARVSFQVSSRVDSRCILDEIGAERLIGRGDLLYLPAGQSKPTRVQGAFVSDDEMNQLIAYLKTQAPPQYRDEIENFGKATGGAEALDDDHDDLLDDAVRVVVETGQASISMVQRKLRVGYTRAARLIDMMERRGIVGPHVGSKAREILVPAAGNSNEVA